MRKQEANPIRQQRPSRARRVMWGVLLLVMLWMTSACTTGKGATRNLSPDQAVIPVQNLDLDPTLIRVNRDGKTTTINADDVFQSAYKAFSARRYEEAIKHYDTIITYFPKSRFVLPSLYNGGLSSEKLERWEAAARNYKKIIRDFPKKPDAKDAYFRLAKVFLKTNRAKETVDLMTEVMLRPDLNHFDRIEAHIRRATALQETGRYNEAREGFRSVLSLNRRAKAEEKLADNAEFVVQAQFGIGRAYHGEVLASKLTLPPKKMEADLKEKGRLFISAQSAYIRAIRVHHPRWSVAAGYMVGRLYEDFYLQIFSAEIPDDIRKNPEAVSLYFEELRKHIRPLMVRAIQVYEKNISFSKRIVRDSGNHDWTNQTQQNLNRLKAYLNDPFTRRRAERLVVQGRPLKQLWNPRLMARDVVEEAVERAQKVSAKAKPSPTKKSPPAATTPSKKTGVSPKGTAAAPQTS